MSLFNKVTKTFQWGKHTVTMETGEVARQASGAVLLNMDDTVVLATVVNRLLYAKAKHVADNAQLHMRLIKLLRVPGMVVEKLKNQDGKAVYRKLRDKGRALPDGLTFVASYVTADLGRCFQLMECDDLRQLQTWVLHWRGTGVTFEIVPVLESSATREVVAPFLDNP